MKYAKSKNLTVFDVVTIASIIEREAGGAEAAQTGRLGDLQPPARRDDAGDRLDDPLRHRQLRKAADPVASWKANSPYNTRTHAGLPPGPINSPGLAAINAAAHPAKTDYLFFVNNPNSCNELTFAKTEEEFLANEAKYEKAREANGGNQPTTCK